MLSKSAIRAKRRGNHYKESGVQSLDVDAKRQGTAIWRLNKAKGQADRIFRDRGIIRNGGHAKDSILWNKNIRRFWIRADIESGTQNARLISSFRNFCRLYLQF